MDRLRLNGILIKWSRKIHLYLGLGMLLFIMLFGFSGLQLNHHWAFTRFWDKREETSYDRSVQISIERDQEALAREIMNKADLHGSIFNPEFSDDSLMLEFVVAKPGKRYELKANLGDGNIHIKEVTFNAWGTMQNLHTIRNPGPKERNERYSSRLASIWSFSIDMIATGLIMMCLLGLYLWTQAERKRFYLGLISLAAGLIICVYALLF